jgi:hypothetical protein
VVLILQHRTTPADDPFEKLRGLKLADNIFDHSYTVIHNSDGSYQVQGGDLGSVTVNDASPDQKNDDLTQLGDPVGPQDNQIDRFQVGSGATAVTYTYVGKVGTAGNQFIASTTSGGTTTYRLFSDTTVDTGGTFTATPGPTPICFLPGTLIATAGGETAVESLKCGDLVKTADGRIASVRWVGRQTISTLFADPLRVNPICIKAGALAENVPSRDLYVSPDHAILVDDILVHASALVNGTSIVRAPAPAKTFTYYHVELADHSLLLADNVPAESFIDNVDRMAFDNWDEHDALGDEAAPLVEMAYPRAKAARQVPVAMRERLAARARALFGAVATQAA